MHWARIHLNEATQRHLSGDPRMEDIRSSYTICSAYSWVALKVAGKLR